MSRRDRLLYVRKQLQKARENSFPPLERNPAWDEEDRKRWSRYPLKPEYDPLYIAAEETATPQPEPPPAPPPAPQPALVVAAASSPQPDTPKSEPPPFDETVTALAKVLRKFLVCSDYHIVVLALWIIHTYCYDIFPSTPYLNIYSPEKQSGKTICMGLLNVLASKAWMPGGGTAPPRIMSRIARCRPTLLLDDWQLVFRPSVSQQFIAFLSASCADGSRFPVPGNEDADQEIFCPKAFAGSVCLPPVLGDRSIPIVLQRRKPADLVMPGWPGMISMVASPLVEPISLWARDNWRNVNHFSCQLPLSDIPGLSMRQRECALPLVAVAHAIGGKWPRRARLSLRRIFDTHAAAQDPSIGLQLLEDIRGFFMSKETDKVLSHDLVDYLGRLEDRPWKHYHQKKALTFNGMRHLLRNYDVPCSSTLRMGSEKRGKGFRRAHFESAWETYLPPLPQPAEVVPNAPEVVPNAFEVVPNECEVVPKFNEIWVNSNE